MIIVAVIFMSLVYGDFGIILALIPLKKLDS